MLKGSSNWEVWKFRTSIMLKAKGAYEVCVNKEKPTEDEDKQLKEWIVKDRVAQEIITSRVDEIQLRYLVSCETAYAIWNKLLAIFDRKSEVSLHVVQQQFFAYKYENRGVSHHISRLEDMVSKIKMLGEEISEKMLMTKILISLPSDYDHFVPAWESTENKSLNELMSRLLIEEERLLSRRDGDGESSSETAFASRSKPLKCSICQKTGHDRSKCYKNKSNLHANSDKTKNCFYCKKPGHFVKDCEVLKKKDGKNVKRHAYMALTSENMQSGHFWVVDSGSTEHMTHERHIFDFIDPVSRKVKISDGSCLEAKGIGDISIQTFNGIEWVPGIFKNVLYVPELKVNLFSVSSTVDKGHKFKIEGDSCKITDKNDECWAVGSRDGMLYKMKIMYDNMFAANSNTTVSTLFDWHVKLGHQNFSYIKSVLKKHNIDFSESSEFCESCIYGKQHINSYGKSTSPAENVCDIVSADLCGPMETTSVGGSRYFLLLKDHYSKFRFVYFLKTKTDIVSKFKMFLASAKRHTGRDVKIIRTDNGLEFVNSEVKSVLDSYGIHHQKSVSYCPRQNGKIEREMRTVVESARTMLISRQLDKCLWAEAVNMAVYVLNASGTSSIKGRTPWELWYGSEFKSFSDLHEFGVEVFVHIPKQKRRKWDAKSRKGIFVGNDLDSKGFRVYFPEEHKIDVVRDVVFKPSSPVTLVQTNSYRLVFPTEDVQIEMESEDLGDDRTAPEEEEEPFRGFEDTEDCLIEKEPMLPKKKEEPRHSYNLRKQEEIKKPSKYQDYQSAAYFCDFEDLSLDEAISDPGWNSAMEEEMEALTKNCTWTLVDLPLEKKPLTCKWVFRKKISDEGEKKKARLVVRGFEQQQGIDYTETFSPVAGYESIRFLLALAVRRNYLLYQFDVKTAFLNGNLEEELYMLQPEGFRDGTERVCKLVKSLYGLKQAPRNWHSTFSMFLSEQGFVSCAADECIFVKTGENLVILCLYVDDGLILGKSKTEIINLLDKLNKKFNITFGEAKNYLGMRIQHINDSIFISQPAYTWKIMARFKMEQCDPVSTPMEPHHEEINKETAKNKPYREAIGSLLYLSNVTRPDLAYSVNYLSRFMENPTIEHWKELKRIFKYLKGTYNYGLLYEKGSNLQIYSDADFAGDLSERKSTSGFVITMSGAAVAWGSRRQNCTALSTAEAEFIAACEAIKELMWIVYLYQEVDFYNELTPFFIDNKSALCMIEKNDGKTLRRTKHVRVRFHFLLEHCNKVFSFNHIGSEKQISDILTKPLGRCKFEFFRLLLGVKSFFEDNNN